jgi:hypothetical protein
VRSTRGKHKGPSGEDNNIHPIVGGAADRIARGATVASFKLSLSHPDMGHRRRHRAGRRYPRSNERTCRRRRSWKENIRSECSRRKMDRDSCCDWIYRYHSRHSLRLNPRNDLVKLITARHSDTVERARHLISRGFSCLSSTFKSASHAVAVYFTPGGARSGADCTRRSSDALRRGSSTGLRTSANGRIPVGQNSILDLDGP